MIRQTPAALGYRMPAEWEPHEATWLAWPHNHDDWPGKFAPIAWVYCEIVRRVAPFEKVRIVIKGEAAEHLARRQLKKANANLDAVEFFRHPTDRSWIRDFGPIFVTNPAGDIAMTDWRFNGWAKYPNWHKDNDIPTQLARRLKMRRFAADLTLEGGSIDVNGRGTLLTTEECLLSPVQARNPKMRRPEIECALSDYLGAREVLWLNRGIAGDDTHGHIDDLARFADSDTIVTVSQSDKSDVDFEPLRENLDRLKKTRFRVVPLPMPEPVIFEGRRLPASYANFYLANHTVLVPTFNDPNDRIALKTLAKVFPDRQVCGIHSGDLVWGLGTLHCATQQQPSGD